MRSRVTVLLAVAFLGVGASSQEVSQASEAAQTRQTPPEGGIRGVWKVTELASRAPGAGWEIRGTPYLSQYIFTEEHYSYMYVPGPNPRKRFVGDPNNPTDAEKAEAYSSLVAATGVYSLSGQTLTLNALVHKNPNEMGGVSLTYTVDLDGNTLQMVIANPPFMPGREWRTVLTRVE
jgi:Lipocalin-like domain